MELMIPREDYKNYRMNKGELYKNKKLDRFLSWETSAGRNMFSIESIDERLRIAAKFLLDRQNIAVVCSEREKSSAEAFSGLVGARAIPHYKSSLFSNPENKDYIEPDAIFILNCDEHRNVIEEADLNNIPVLAFCNTNSKIDGLDLVVPLNVTNRNAIRIALWLIANEILRAKGQKPVLLEGFGKEEQSDEDLE
jgi:small subunit ribosomal protein SAe